MTSVQFPTSAPGSMAADDIGQWAYLSQDELYGLDNAEREAWQLWSARRRFEQLQPSVKALAEHAQERAVTRIDSLDDLTALFFDHSTYKSYPLSLLEKNRFDHLTRWLGRFTSIDLSGVNVDGIDSIDGWLDALEQQTSLQVFHTSGTSGKLSFIPRTTLELDMYMTSFLNTYRGFGSEGGVRLGGSDGERMPVIYPSVRYGRYVAQRMVQCLEKVLAPSPDQCYTVSDGRLSADLVSLSGRIRVAQAKGEVSQMRLSESQRVALKQYLDAQARRPEAMVDFFGRTIDQLRGKRVYLFSQSSFLVQSAQEGLSRGLQQVFSPDSLGTTGGGGKDLQLPPDWRELSSAFTGIPRWQMYFGMTELIGVWPSCPHNRYHIPPYHIVYQLDPVSGAILPRENEQTGRLAVMDLLAQHYWGGVLTGDKGTIEWTRPCGCGRKGPHMAHDVERYAVEVTGDDKITCAETVDNTDAALQKLLAG